MPEFQTYNRSGKKCQVVSGTIAHTRQEKEVLPDGRVLRLVDFWPSGGGPDITVYLEVKDIPPCI